MDDKTTVIILAAGKGSRMEGIPSKINKCVYDWGGNNPLSYTTKTFRSLGIEDFLIVTGYGHESIEEVLKELKKRTNIETVHNNNYEVYGCNYSLSCAVTSKKVNDAERIIIVEGDSLHSKELLSKVVESPLEASVLLRDKTFVDEKRSVVALGTDHKVKKFVYDMSHAGKLNYNSEEDQVIGESMQVWSFRGDSLKRLLATLKEYYEWTPEADSEKMHSGVHSINKAQLTMEPIWAKYPEEWINMNTQEDYRKAGQTEWIN